MTEAEQITTQEQTILRMRAELAEEKLKVANLARIIERKDHIIKRLTEQAAEANRVFK